MAVNIDIPTLQIKMAAHPKPGVTTIREHMYDHHINELVYGHRYTLLVTSNYICHGPYHHLDQVIEYNGFNATLYVSFNSPNQQISRTVKDFEELQSLIPQMHITASAKCPHSRSRLIQNISYCYNEFECLDCHEHFSRDSTD